MWFGTLLKILSRQKCFHSEAFTIIKIKVSCKTHKMDVYEPADWLEWTPVLLHFTDLNLMRNKATKNISLEYMYMKNVGIITASTTHFSVMLL